MNTMRKRVALTCIFILIMLLTVIIESALFVFTIQLFADHEPSMLVGVGALFIVGVYYLFAWRGFSDVIKELENKERGTV